jgi:hypothetical protein
MIWIEALLFLAWGSATFLAGTWWATRPRQTLWKDITHD